jgi:hypothetical protein
LLQGGGHEPAGVLEIAECTGHIQGAGKKDSGFTTGFFVPQITRIDRCNQLVDCVFFDRASDVQKAGKIIQLHYPRVMVLHGADHGVSRFFKDLSNIKVL